MAARPLVLVALSALLGALAPLRAQATEPLCVRCHAPHFRVVGACVDCHEGVPAASRAELAHAGLIGARHATFGVPGAAAPERGAALVDLLGCRRCHAAGGSGAPRASDLDAAARQALPD
ncbi:MAG: cytochrome C, partial [Deltaproteobacteria bacterium HGW-Deltaproteobacteria-14]